MIYGVQKLSLVDYPKEPAFVIFLGGCNFRCPFCHNKGIVEKEYPSLREEDVFAQIEARRHFVNAIVVTGGEPTIYGEKLLAFLKKIRQFDLKIKLDTNGTNPDLLQKIIDQNLVDYIAMDLKNTYDKYEMTCGISVMIQKIKASIHIIEESNLSYDFRTTVNKEMHTRNNIEEMITYMKDSTHYYLQNYRYSDQQIVDHDFGSYEDSELDLLQDSFGYQVKN